MHPPVACYEQSLHSSALELKYAHSTHLVDMIAKDEDIRRLRVEIRISEDDNDELRDQLEQDQEHAKRLESLVNENLLRAESAEEEIRSLTIDLNTREQGMLKLQAENETLKNTNQDATAELADKLALTRELGALRPQLEHVKAQAAKAETLMAEKLDLQRQVMDMQCDLENAKRETKRAMAKRRNTGVEIAQEEQVEELKRLLAKEKRARQRAEQAPDNSQGDVQIDDVRKQLNKERKARQKAEEQLEAAQEATQVEDVRKDLLAEKKTKAKLEEAMENLRAELDRERKAAARAAKRAEGNAEADEEAEELRQELAKEKKEHARTQKTAQQAEEMRLELATAKKDHASAQKAAQQAAEESAARNTTLQEKLQNFRATMRTRKTDLANAQSQLAAVSEELATAREELAAAQEAPAPAKKTKAAAKATAKKRNAAQMEPDASALGTPGDGPATKRGRKAAPTVGDKSTFSITPFLNKTVSVVQEDEDEEAASPAATKQAKRPLTDQPSKANVPPKKAQRAKKGKRAPMLELITEEDENSQPKEKSQPQKIATKTADGPAETTANDKNKKKPRIRKSLADFQSFNPEPDVEKKKKRKLGGLGKTLFDEEEEAAPTGKTGFVSRGLFGGAKAGGLKKSGLGSSMLAAGRSKLGSSVLMAAGDGSGFQFSPLKKQRKGLDDTLRLG